MLAEWLASYRVTRVGMESTGCYWKPGWHLLEDQVECWLLNAAHMHNVPGCNVKDRGTSPLSIIEIPHFAGTGWAAHYRVVVGVTSACLAAARKLSARARWVRIR